MPWNTVAATAAVIAAATGVTTANLGRPARLRPINCVNCGAPHEPGRCSYCLTPNGPGTGSGAYASADVTMSEQWLVEVGIK